MPGTTREVWPSSFLCRMSRTVARTQWRVAVIIAFLVLKIKILRSDTCYKKIYKWSWRRIYSWYIPRLHEVCLPPTTLRAWRKTLIICYLFQHIESRKAWNEIHCKKYGGKNYKTQGITLMLLITPAGPPLSSHLHMPKHIRKSMNLAHSSSL